MIFFGILKHLDAQWNRIVENIKKLLSTLKFATYVWKWNQFAKRTIFAKFFPMHINVTPIIIPHQFLFIFYQAFVSTIIIRIQMWKKCCLTKETIFLFSPCLFLTASEVLYIECIRFHLKAILKYLQMILPFQRNVRSL